MRPRQLDHLAHVQQTCFDLSTIFFTKRAPQPPQLRADHIVLGDGRLGSEMALTAALAEMYVKGVSTRKVNAITEEL